MIDGPGHLTGQLVIPLKEETTMLKTISAALLAVSVLAAPALAVGQSKTTQAPVIKTEQAKQLKPNVRNANARMGHHHAHFRHHRFHRHMGALKPHHVSKVAIKHAGPATKRG
jgi:isocitrate lyase